MNKRAGWAPNAHAMPQVALRNPCNLRQAFSYPPWCDWLYWLYWCDWLCDLRALLHLKSCKGRQNAQSSWKQPVMWAWLPQRVNDQRGPLKESMVKFGDFAQFNCLILCSFCRLEAKSFFTQILESFEMPTSAFVRISAHCCRTAWRANWMVSLLPLGCHPWCRSVTVYQQICGFPFAQMMFPSKRTLHVGLEHITPGSAPWLESWPSFL